MPTLDGEKRPGQSQTNQFRFVVDVILRYWAAVVALSVTGAIVGAAVGSMLGDETYEYEAYGDLHIQPSVWNTPIMASLGGAMFAKLTPKALKDQTNMSQLADDVARAMVSEDIQNGAALSGITTEDELGGLSATVQRSLSLEDIGESGVLRVRVRAASAGDARRTADNALRALVRYTHERQMQAQDEAYSLVRGQLRDLGTELDRVESLQWDYRERMGFRTHEQTWKDMEARNSELNETVARIEENEARRIELDAALRDNRKNLPDSLGMVTDKVVQDLLDELDAARREQVVLSVVWRKGYPGLDAVEDEISQKKEAILVAISEFESVGGGGANLWDQRQDLYRRKVDLDLELTTLQIRKSSLRRSLGEMVENLPSIADTNLEFDQLSHEAEQVRSQFNKLLEKEFEIRTALDRGAAKIERREAVIVSTHFSGRGSQTLGFGIVGGIIGFLVAFAFSMMYEMMDTSVKSIEDAQDALDLEVIGMIPEMKFGPPGPFSRGRGVHVVSTDEEQVDACIVTQYDPKSPVSEAYRSFRTNFQFATLQEKPRTVMITSAVPGEGKTTTAVNFAVTMADRGMRVLIVDTDLRRPNVHRVLKMERGPGLADVLRERIPVKNVIRSTRTENLYIISSGRVPPNPSELVGSDRMQQLMHDLGDAFDLVVCDAPSVLVVTDPVLLATYVDTVVLVVSVHNARIETIQRAKKLLETANPAIAGVVLNGLEATRRHYYYYYYYYDDRAAPRRRRWSLTS